MAVHASAGSASRVMELYDEMIARELTPTHSHYVLALTALSESSLRDLPRTVSRAEAVCVAMRRAGCRLDTRTLLSLEKLCQRHHRDDVASRLRAQRSLAPMGRPILDAP